MKNISPVVKWLGICIGLAVLAFIAVWLFKVPVSNLYLLSAPLLCLLMHFWMMKDGGHKH